MFSSFVGFLPGFLLGSKLESLKRGSHIPTPRPKCIACSYMDPFGKLSLQLWVLDLRLLSGESLLGNFLHGHRDTRWGAYRSKSFASLEKTLGAGLCQARRAGYQCVAMTRTSFAYVSPGVLRVEDFCS